jgi:imidazolonepropionase-like amidohydrolase
MYRFYRPDRGRRGRSALLLLAMAAPPLAAQSRAPATYAITNARLVPVSGPVIDQGTIVIRDGLIAAIGAQVKVPADARVIDGSGLSVYPGLIDSYTSLGYPAASSAAAGRGGAGGRGVATTTSAADGAPNSRYGVGMQPEVRAVDQLDPADDAFDAAHSAGFTTALTSNATGIYRGQSALIDLDGTDVNAMVVASPIAQHIGFSRGGGRGFGGGGGFPSSLMGVFAQLRQELLDAQHYRDLMAAYQRNPNGMQRPDYDPSLEALQPVIAGTQPVVMFANTEREIVRALDLAEQFHLKAAIAGGAEAYKVADRLKADGVPVLLTLNFPKRPANGAARGGGGGGRGGASADQPEPLRLLRDRVMAPKGPGILAKAGVRFVFESGDDYSDALTNLRKAVTAGLSQDAALRALTIDPATLFGAADKLGTLETGKIANLTVAKGDLFDASSRVTQLFVDGQPIDVTQPAAGTGRGGRGSAGQELDGRWLASVTIDGVARHVTLDLQQDEARLYGAVQGDLGAMDIIDGGVDSDGSLYFTVMLTMNGSTDEAEFDGTLANGSIRGALSVEGSNAGTFSAGRAQ